MMSIQSKFGLLWVCVMLLVCDTLTANFIGDKQFTRGKIVVKQYKLDNEVTVGELKSVDPDTELFKTVKALTGPNGGKLLEQLTQTSALAVGAPASDLPPEISFIVLGATPIRGTFIGKNRIVVRLPKSVYGGFISIRPPNAPLSQTTIRAVTPDQLTNPAGGVLKIPITCNGKP